MKQRFSYLDLLLVAKELRPQLIGERLNNIYTLVSNARHQLYKFDLKDRKLLLLVDPGYRVHETTVQHPTSPQPSYFVSKLRKFLRQRRVTDLRVARNSRCLTLELNDGQFSLVFEFFAGGNVILLDSEHQILALSRHINSPEFAVGAHYDFGEGSELGSGSIISAPDEANLSKLMPLKKVARSLFSIVPQSSLSLLEYCLRAEGVDPKKDCDDSVKVMAALNHLVSWTNTIASQSQCKGYILRSSDDQPLEFEPFAEYFKQELEQNPSLRIVETQTYNQTVDAYFSTLLSNKQESRVDELKKIADSRLDAARNEAKSRVDGLDKVYEENQLKGRVIEANANLVTAAIYNVNHLQNNGIDWGSIKDLIRAEAGRGNPVARTIVDLDLAKRQISLKLPGETALESDEKNTVADITVNVNLDQTAFANARNYFEIRRAAVIKKEKTLEQADKAYRMAQKKIKSDLQKKLSGLTTQNGPLLTVRTKYWFEKFYWFFTSDNSIVIAGRDKMQNTLLLNRYFSDRDVTVSCDEHGAALTIIKARPNLDVSPQAIDQAAAFSIASSESWGKKSNIRAWWLDRAKVPRLRANGDPITVQDLYTNTKKQYVSPVNTDIGIGLLWQVSMSGGPESQPTSVADSDPDEEEFPDTELYSDEEFSDTEINTDDGSDSQTEDEREPVEDSGDSSAVSSRSVSPVSGSETNSSLTSASEGMPSNFGISELALEASNDEEVRKSPTTSHIEHSKKVPQKVRGKAKKLQKMKKYQDQDEEDRQKALERLGTLKGLQRAEKERQEKEAEKQRLLESQRLREQRERDRFLKLISGDQVETTDYPLDLVTKMPPDERIRAIVPTCAPMKSLSGLDFKIKIIPGLAKKGKTVTEALRIILETNPSSSSEVKSKLMESVRSEDLQQSVPQTRLQLSVVGRLSKGAPSKSQPGREKPKSAPRKDQGKGKSKGKK